MALKLGCHLVDVECPARQEEGPREEAEDKPSTLMRMLASKKSATDGMSLVIVNTQPTAISPVGGLAYRPWMSRMCPFGKIMLCYVAAMCPVRELSPTIMTPVMTNVDGGSNVR